MYPNKVPFAAEIGANPAAAQQNLTSNLVGWRTQKALGV
jgi:hypothetical protein